MTGWDAVFGKALDPALSARLDRIWPAPPVEAAADGILFADGTRARVEGAVPRFVPDDGYVDSFSYQWHRFQTTQVDSAQQERLTETDLLHKTGLTPETVRGRLVLDAGVGVGRHAEVLAGWGAHVVGLDLSRSVDVAVANLARFPNAVVLQGDLMAPPFAPGSFDVVMSIGVLHHTPDTRRALESVARLVAPGGRLAVWVYAEGFARRKEWIPAASRLPRAAFLDWCAWAVDAARAAPDHPVLATMRQQLPFAIHHPTAERSVLALFDGYTPTYHGVHTTAEVAGWVTALGFEDVRPHQVPTSISARRPAGPSS
jgi:SAM-dependent methyltransferase